MKMNVHSNIIILTRGYYSPFSSQCNTYKFRAFHAPSHCELLLNTARKSVLVFNVCKLKHGKHVLHLDFVTQQKTTNQDSIIYTIIFMVFRELHDVKSLRWEAIGFRAKISFAHLACSKY